ncbi:uncharacterized protein [Parasteatoda tepidariorum]|uniref:uncharacterized protein n=1 Tax=Parasteatoda tepidariorum TaxID=114398 RepID=UPI0039BD2E28
MSAWARTHKLTFSQDKTKIIVLNKDNKKTSRTPRIKMDQSSTNLKIINSLKYLGVLLDPGLTWIPHLNEVKDKITNFNQMSKRVARATWGLSPYILKKIYLQASEKVIIYAASVCYRNTNKINQKLASIQRIPLRTITKCYSTASTESILILAGIKPIHLKVIETIFNKCIKWGWKIDDILPVIQRTVIDSILEKTNLTTKAPVHPVTQLAVPWGYNSPNNNGLEIYTDGSRMEFKPQHFRTGIGVIIKYNGITIAKTSSRASDYCSVFEAELMAIREAINYAAKQEEQTTIYTDSLSSLHELTDPTYKNTIVHDIKHAWRQSISLNLIKAHAGHAGNEEADQLAKEAVRLDIIENTTWLTPIQIKSIINNHIMARWKLDWTNSRKGR